MKTRLLILLTCVMMFSCSGELTPEQLEKDFSEKAMKYMSNKIAKEKSDIESAEIVSIDKVADLTERTIAAIELDPLVRTTQIKLELYNDLKKVDDDFGFETSESTQRAMNDFLETNAELQEASKVMSQKDSVTMVGYEVMATVDFIKTDGSKIKGTKLAFYFDKDRYLDARLMKLMYGE